MSTNKKGISSAEKSREEDNILKRIREGYNLPDAYFSVEVEKAAFIKDIATVLDLEQLTGARFDDFYVETGKVREANTISSLERLLKDPLTPYNKRLFSGFSGSGRTTELTKLCFHLQKEFNVIIFSAWNRLRIDEIKIKFREYLDVLFDIHGGNKTTPEKNLALQDLLRTRAVMKYNGEGFYDTHPLLDNFIKAYKEKRENGKQKSGAADD